MPTMDFDLSKPQKLLQQSARAFFGRECPTERVRALMETETAFDEKLWRALADQGWTGLLIPEEFGGLGLGALPGLVILRRWERRPIAAIAASM